MAVVVGPCVGCSHDHPAALDPYQGATDVSFREFGGADHVTYHVNAKFPAANIIGSISEKLAKEGWKSSQHDELNPGGYAGDVAVWRQRILGSGQKERCAESWMRDWRSASGDFLRYGLVYECRVPEVANEVPVCKCDTSKLTDLEVNGVYMPAKTHQELLEAFDRFEKNLARERDREGNF